MLDAAEQGFVFAVAAHKRQVFAAFGRVEIAFQIALHLIAETAGVAAGAGAESQAGHDWI